LAQSGHRHKLRKRRNIAEICLAETRTDVDAKLVKGFGHLDPEQGLRNAKPPLHD
jgi:hypothetical protein